MTYQLSNLLVINYTFIIYQHIYDELSLAAEAFLDDEGCQVDMAKRTIKLSQILKWYSVDFGKNKEEVSMWWCFIQGYKSGSKKNIAFKIHLYSWTSLMWIQGSNFCLW